MSSIYNAYIPGGEPYEKIPEDGPPGFGSLFSSLFGKNTDSASHSSASGGLSGLLKKLGLNKLDSGDLLLLLILFLLVREGDHSDIFVVLALAAVFLLDGD